MLIGTSNSQILWTRKLFIWKSLWRHRQDSVLLLLLLPLLLLLLLLFLLRNSIGLPQLCLELLMSTSWPQFRLLFLKDRFTLIREDGRELVGGGLAWAGVDGLNQVWRVHSQVRHQVARLLRPQADGLQSHAHEEHCYAAMRGLCHLNLFWIRLDLAAGVRIQLPFGSWDFFVPELIACKGF